MSGHLTDACEAVDAAIFSGDVLYRADQLATLKQYMARWQRAIEAREAAEEQDE